jgi:hypothetical protein
MVPSRGERVRRFINFSSTKERLLVDFVAGEPGE